MKIINIGIDIDGVIIDLVETMLPYLSEKCGYTVKHTDIWCYDIGKALGIEDEMTDIWGKVYESENLRNAPPIKGAIESLKKLSANNLFILTGRPPETRIDTEWWFMKHDIKPNKLEFVLDNDKRMLAREYKIDVFVEDCLEQAIFLSEDGINTFLIDKPWNRESLINNKYRRVYNWQNILSNIELLASE